MMAKRENELKQILNTVEFGTEVWEKASTELRQIRANDIAKNPVKTDKNWCTTDGQWWE